MPTPFGPPEPRQAITCAACGGHIITVTTSVARAFASGSWLCGDATCQANR